MKICMFSIGHLLINPTGGAKRFLELYAALLKENCDVTLYSGDSEGKFGENDMVNCYSLNISTNSGNNVAVNVLLNNGTVFKDIKIAQYDVVVVFDVRAAILLSIKHIKHIVLFFRQDTIGYKKIILNDRDIPLLKKKIILYVLKKCEEICIKNAEVICVQCKYDLDNLVKRHGRIESEIRKKSFIQINNVNPSWITKYCQTRKSSETHYDISFIGNFRDSRKGHDLLLRVLKQLTDEGETLSAVIIGGGKDLEYYKNLYRDYQNIVFTGNLGDPIPIITKSSLMVVPSYADSCPNTVMEALYYEIPVIGAKSGGIPEILNNEQWLFELTELSLYKKIKIALSEKEIIHNSQILRKHELEFNWGSAVWNNIYDRLR